MFLKFLKLILLIVLIPDHKISAQVSWKGASDIGQLKWWLGIKTGPTFSHVKITERHSVMSNFGEKDTKRYSGTLKNMGQTVGVIFGYAVLPNIMVTFQPAYSNYKYMYSTGKSWNNYYGNSYLISTKQSHRIGYIEFPLLFLLRIPMGRFEPYVNIGAHYGKFAGGRKKIKYTESFNESGVPLDEEEMTETIGLSEYIMKSQAGLAGGIGLFYTIQYFRIGLELSYKTGQFNLTNVKTRYSDKHVISKFFEIPDDLRLNHIDLTLNMFMPLDNLIHLHSGQKTKAGRRQ